MSALKPIIDGLGNFIGVVLIAPPTAAVGVAKRLHSRSKQNKDDVDELKRELDWNDDDGESQRLERIERDMSGIRQSLDRQERQHDRVEGYLVGNDEVPHESVFERLDQIEEKIDE